MVAMGQMSDTALGLEAAGVVRRVGSAVSKFKVGDNSSSLVNINVPFANVTVDIPMLG